MKKKVGILVLACVMVLGALVLPGCRQRTVEGVSYTRDRTGSIEFTDAQGTWRYSAQGRVAKVTLNDGEVLLVERHKAQAQVEEKTFTVQLDRDLKPTTVTVPWGTDLGAAHYTFMAQALEYNRLGSLAYGGTPWVVVVIMVALIACGVLILVYAPKIASFGAGFGSSGRGGRKLLILRLVGGILVAVALIVLVIVLFA